MGLFDKLKNIFIEDEFDEEPISVPKKNEKVENIEIKENVIEKEKTKDIENTFSDRELLESNEKFKFPIIFEDDDFKDERKKTKSINVLERENNKYEPEIKREVRPQQKKVFKPSPVISPVYGVLDKNYSKDDISSKDGLLNDSSLKVDIDSVMKKAYGEDKIMSREEKNKVEKSENTNLFDDLKDLETDISSNEIMSESDILLNDTKNDEIDEKIKSIDELLKDTTDEDFYSLVDSMYKDEEGEEE